MRTGPALLIIALVLLGFAPAGAESTSDVACPPDDGRERLTVDGYDATFDAPVVTYPGLASPVDNNVGPTQELRSAPFSFTVDVAPSSSAQLKITLDWAEFSDFDFFVFDDATGTEIGRSAEDNTANGLTHEETVVTGAHCQQITVAVRSWSGSALEQLSLTIAVTPSSTLLACADADPAPNCVGKEEGEAPDPSPADTRTRLYLGGDPGQAAMLWRYVQNQSQQENEVLPRAWLAPERPTSGVPNSHTRLLVGFRRDHATAHGNPLIPHWSYRFEEPTDLAGTVTAVLWASSRTQDETGRFYVDLWADGQLLGSVEIPGSAIGQEPTRLTATFTDVSFPNATEVSLQAATEPVATSSGVVNNPHDAEVTVHYGSVQFPAFVTLP